MVELHANFTADGSKTAEDGVLPQQPCAAPDPGNSPKVSPAVRDRVLRVYQYPARWRVAVGRRSHPAEGPRARVLALARGSEPVQRIRLPATGLLSRHLDLGNSPHRKT